MRVLVALLAFAPAAALACAMPSDRRLEAALADIDEALAPPAPQAVAPPPEKAPPAVAAPAPVAIPEVTPAPVVQPRS